MKEINIITEKLRNYLRKEFNDLKDDIIKNENYKKEKFYNDIDNDESFEDFENEFEDDFNDEEFEDNDSYDLEIFQKTIQGLFYEINSNDYKEIIYSIILNDVYEFLKVDQILDKKLNENEYNIIKDLENKELKELFKKLNEDEFFLLDIFDLYFVYDQENFIEDRYKNRKLIELTNNSKYLDKFRIYKFDNMQYQLIKTRNNY